MYLEDLITALEAIPRNTIVKHGFGRARSYRGSYEDLAFEPESNVTIGSMLDIARGALGCTFQGYKGGTYLMSTWTQCWISPYGEASGDGLSTQLIAYWAEEPQ